jgi:hypothetical protein
VTRTARAAAAASSALLTVLLTAGPALAEHGEGEDTSAEVDIKGALVLYVLLPAVILLGMAALVWLPGVVRNERYRPQKGWSAPPLWFSGPPEPDAAVEAAQPGDMVRGGASGSW